VSDEQVNRKCRPRNTSVRYNF